MLRRVVETAYPGIGLTSMNGEMQGQWTSSARQYNVDLTIVMLGSWDVSWEQQHGAAARPQMRTFPIKTRILAFLVLVSLLLLFALGLWKIIELWRH